MRAGRPVFYLLNLSKSNIKLIRKKILADFITPVAAFTFYKESRYSFLLESVEKGYTGRYSFLGFNPSRVYELYRNKVRILKRIAENKFKKIQEINTPDPLNIVQEVQKKYRIIDENDLPPFCGGLVGYVGYEMIGSWERLEFKNPVKPELPLGIFTLTDELIAFDHLYNTAEVIKVVDTEEEDSTSCMNKAEERVDEIITMLNSRPALLKNLVLKNKNRITIKSNFTASEFKKKVNSIKKEIFRGEIIQGVFSQRLETSAIDDPFNYYRALRVINPSPYMFYLKLDDIILCGSSPEVMVKVIGNRALVKPIAGTKPRGKTKELEKELMTELKSDIKERAEHIMLVDLGRNDLGKVCEYGTVKVKNLMSVEKYSHVMHMVTDVSGKIRPGVTNIDVFKACFPAGTVSGAPKIRAIQIIEEQENLARGPYAGAVGYFSFNSDMDMGITIRTMVVHNGRVYVQAGAGIVADSVPEKEYEETLNKAKALLESVRLVSG